MEPATAKTVRTCHKFVQSNEAIYPTYEHKFTGSQRYSSNHVNTDGNIHFMTDQSNTCIKTGVMIDQSNHGICGGTCLKMNLDPDHRYSYLKTGRLFSQQSAFSGHTESLSSGTRESFAKMYSLYDQYTPERNPLLFGCQKPEISKPLFLSFESENRAGHISYGGCVQMPMNETKNTDNINRLQDENAKRHVIKALSVESQRYSDVKGTNLNSSDLGALKRSTNCNILQYSAATDNGELNLNVIHKHKESLKLKYASFEQHCSNDDTTKRSHSNTIGRSHFDTIRKCFDGKYTDMSNSFQKENLPVDYSLKKRVLNPGELETREFAKIDDCQRPSADNNNGLNESQCNNTVVYNTRTVDKEAKQSGFDLVLNLKESNKPVDVGKTDESSNSNDSVTTNESKVAPNSDKVNIGRVKTSRKYKNQLKVFSCWKCGEKFNSADKLNVHMKVVHDEDCPYRCDHCSRSFSQLNNLRRHLRVHKDNVFKCKLCERVFNEEFHLEFHMGRHMGKRVYSCGICSTSFQSGQDLKRHVKTHSLSQLHTCDVCNKSFSKACVLRQHKKGHMEEHPYMCEKCQKTFVHRHHLISHLKSHKEPHIAHKSHIFNGNIQQNNIKTLSTNNHNKSASELSTLHGIVHVESCKDQINEKQKHSQIELVANIQKWSLLNPVNSTNSKSKSHQTLDNDHKTMYALDFSRKRMQIISQSASEEVPSQEFNNQQLTNSHALHSSTKFPVVPYAHLVPYNHYGLHTCVPSLYAQLSEMQAYENMYNSYSTCIQAYFNSLLFMNNYSQLPHNLRSQSHAGNRDDQDEGANMRDLHNI